MQQKRRFLWVGSCLVIATVAGALYVTTSRLAERRNDLMSRATLEVPENRWQGGSMQAPLYPWRNDNEVLRLEMTSAGGFAPVALATTGASDISVRRPIATAPLGPPTRFINPLLTSPDGAWLLCDDRSATAPLYFAVALDGSRRRRDWPGLSYGGRSVTWFADSRRFMTVLFDASKSVYVARVFSVDAPGVSTPVRLNGVSLDGSGSVGALPSGRFLGRDDSSDYAGPGTKTVTSERVTVTEFGLDRGSTAPRSFTIAAPTTPLGVSGSGGATVIRHRTLRVSPQGDRVLWIVSTFESSSPLGSGSKVGRRLHPFLQRVLPRFFDPSRNIRHHYELATARLDGRGGVTPLGAVTGPTRRGVGGGYSYGFIGDWAWTPDGKRVSFTYDRALYTVPVPDSPP